VRWFDIDLPEVIALREQLYPERAGYRRIGASVTDLAWLTAIPGDRPVFVVAEGLVMYLPAPGGAALFRQITAQFPSGQIAFDAYSGAMVRLVARLATVRRAKVELVWGIDDPHDLEALVPQLHLVENVPFLTMPELTGRLATNGASWAQHRIMGQLPFYRNLIRHLRYAFAGEPVTKDDHATPATDNQPL
jgi:O-methyltransferase involved in polyketide biosynthesis